VPHFPANVNIAAALALAGIGFDRKRLTVAADPALKFNTHFARIRGASGPIDLRFENVAVARQSEDRDAGRASARSRRTSNSTRRCVTGPRDGLESDIEG
jgi:aspartate dehydrogenase